MRPPKAARWLDLLAYLLQHRFPVTREDVFRNVAEYRRGLEEGTDPESVRRKFERDKDELRELGIAIETVALPAQAGDEPAVGYRLRARDFYLPYLELQPAPPAPPAGPYAGLTRVTLTKEDLARLDRATQRVAASGVPVLAEAAVSARRKLAFDLPLPLASVERVLSRSLGGAGAQALGILQRAVTARTAVRCRYYAIGRDAEEERVLEPYGLFFNWGRWYAVAWSRERGALRIFRVDRMRDAEPLTGADASFAVPADFHIRDYVGRAPWELGDQPPTRVTVRFAFPESRWVQAQGVGEVVEPVLDDGGAVLAFAVRESGAFLRWLLTFRGQARVLEPSSTAADLAALRGRVAALYARDAR
jgi:predicted DNA-binding transcriptional regulator YafY